MRAKHPIRIVREVTGMTQERFAEALGVHRSYLARIETGRKPFTNDFQRKVAILTGAWIGIGEDKEPLSPVPIAGWSTFAGGETPEPFFLNGQCQPYEKKDWESWRGNRGDYALGFDGENEPLAFWLVLLLAAAVRAEKEGGVRAEMLHALERVRAEYQLDPHVSAILRQYKPLVKEGNEGHLPAPWFPSSRPPRWLREAIAMEPLRVHVTPPKRKRGRYLMALQKIVGEGKKTFLALLQTNPGQAVDWVRENWFWGPLSQLAMRKAEERFRAMLHEDEAEAVKWARANWPTGHWKAILKEHRQRSK
jgi:transcriptional regulator with XRE-family HTH domain